MSDFSYSSSENGLDSQPSLHLEFEGTESPSDLESTQSPSDLESTPKRQKTNDGRAHSARARVLRPLSPSISEAGSESDSILVIIILM